MKLKKQYLFLAIIIISSYNDIWCQSEMHWTAKLGLHYSNMSFHHLPSINSMSVFDSMYNFVGFRNTYIDGRFEKRAGISLMIYKERKLKKWLNAVVGIGYRQKGYNSAKLYGVAYGLTYPNGLIIKKDVEARFHYITAELALRMYFYKKWYLLATGRFDVLVARKSTEEHEYISNSLKRLEISPTLAIGKEIIICDYIFFAEFEVNRGLQNITRMQPDFPGMPPTKLWNLIYGVNVGMKF